MGDLYASTGARGPKGDTEPRCVSCGRMLARFLTRPWRIDCPKCKTPNGRAR